MYLISAEGYKNADVHFLKVRKTGEIWSSMKDVVTGMIVKNISDLWHSETKNPTKEKIKKCKMTEKKIYESLSEDELNAKSNKNIYVRNDVMATIIKRCRGEKKGCKSYTLI